LAHRRAAALAERGLGDAAIRFRLERDGIEREFVEPALAELEPEYDRAVRLAARRGPAPKTARWLAARGFAPDSIEAAIGGIADDERLELG
jgi:SOS response regulatory protein OraA/RecX